MSGQVDVGRTDSVVFDLDGTLWDTCVACALAWNKVIARHGIAFRTVTADDVRKVTGKPHEVCIRETFAGLDEAQLQQLVRDTMTEDNLLVAQCGGVLYDGVAEGLKELAKRYPLFIVSNCQSGYIETFLSFSGFKALFRDFECWGNTGNPKAENLADIIHRNVLRHPVMIGDMESDLVAARTCAIPFIYVTYGFGEVSDCDASVDSFGELGRLLLGSMK